MISPKAEDPWANEGSSYNRGPTKYGGIHIDGILFMDDVYYSFRLNQKRKTASDGSTILTNLMIGEINTLSRKDGFLLQRSDRTTTTGKHLKEDVLRYQCQIRSTKDKVIKEAIIIDACNFKKKHLKEIEADLAVAKLDLMSPLRAVRYYGRQFILSQAAERTGRRKRTLSESTVDKKMALLEKLAGLIGGHSLSHISPKQLVEVYTALDKSAAKIFRLGFEFWEFLYARGLCDSNNPNPFIAYYEQSCNVREAPDIIRLRAMKPVALPACVDAELVRRIIDNPKPTPDDVALILARDGFTAKRISTLRIKDLTFGTLEPESVCVKQFKKNSITATTDYTRPLSPLAASVVNSFLSYQPASKRNNYLLEIDGKRMSAKTITTLCRTTLLECGMSEREMRADPDNIYGVGIELFQKNFRHILFNHCDLKSEPGAILFLCCMSLASDTTSDNYRSFTCIDGQQHLLAALRRDKRYLRWSGSTEPVFERSSDNTLTTVTIPPKDLLRFTESEFFIELEPGQQVELSSCCPLDVIFEILD